MGGGGGGGGSPGIPLIGSVNTEHSSRLGLIMASVLFALGLGAVAGYWYKQSPRSTNLSEFKRVQKENTQLKYDLFIKIVKSVVVVLILMGGLRVYKSYSPERYEAVKVFILIVAVITLLVCLLWLSRDSLNIVRSNNKLEFLEREVRPSYSGYNVTINILSMPCNNTCIFPASFCAFITIIGCVCYVLFWKI